MKLTNFASAASKYPEFAREFPRFISAVDARLMPAKYVRPYSKGQKNDFRDAEAIAEAVQRPTMKFVATKTAEQLNLQALRRVRERLVSQRTGVINQIRAFLLERGVAVRQGLRVLRAELPGILATRTEVLSPRMVRVVEELAGDWRRLDERIEGLSTEIAALAYQDAACKRLMTVPGVGPRARWLPRLALEMCSPKAATSAPGWGSSRSKSRRETARSSARYPGAAIATCASCSYRQPGSC
jgi:transposase